MHDNFLDLFHPWALVDPLMALLPQVTLRGKANASTHYFGGSEGLNPEVVVCNLFGPNKKMFAPRTGSPNSFLKKLPTSIVKKNRPWKNKYKKNTHKDTIYDSGKEKKIVRFRTTRTSYIPLTVCVMVIYLLSFIVSSVPGYQRKQKYMSSVCTCHHHVEILMTLDHTSLTTVPYYHATCNLQ